MQWTRSPPNLHHEHVLNRRNTWMRSRAYLVTHGGTRSVRSSSRFDHCFIGCGFIGRSRSFAISGIGEHHVDRDRDLHRTDSIATRRDGWIFIERVTKEQIRRTRCSLIFLSPWRRVELSGALDPHQTGDENHAIETAQPT